MADLMEAITSLAKRRGIAFQSSEIYGGLRSSWDYGPLGVELKRNIRAAWWRVDRFLHHHCSVGSRTPLGIMLRP